MPNSFLARKRSKEKKLVDHVFPLSGERVQNTPRPMLLLGCGRLIAESGADLHSAFSRLVSLYLLPEDLLCDRSDVSGSSALPNQRGSRTGSFLGKIDL